MERRPIHKSSTLTLFTESKKITFDNIKGEHNYTKFSLFNFLSYLFLLVSIFLQFAILASDIFTLIQIYHLKNWDSFHTIDYIPVLAYKIVFTICIGISFLYFIFVWLFGFTIQKRNRIVQSFLHTGARQIDSLKSYERFCVYQEISGKTWHEWLRLSIYNAYHYELISWLFADSPRQLLNATTIAYIVSNKFTSGDIAGIISRLAQRDKKQAVLLSFMFFSFIIWIFFTFKYLIIVVSSICIIPSTKRTSGKKYSTYCADLVAKNVSELYNEKAEMYEEELSQRRKIPSFMQNADLGSLGYDIPKATIKTTNKTLDTISLSDSSFDKKSPYKVELKEIPLSHSKVNLTNNSTTEFYRQNNYDKSYEDPFSESMTNLNLSTHDFYHGGNNSQMNLRNSYVYMPAKVYEAHQNDYPNPFNTTKDLENHDYGDASHNDISLYNPAYSSSNAHMIPDLEIEDLEPALEPQASFDAEEEPKMTSKLPEEEPSELYRSRGIGNQPRTLL